MREADHGGFGDLGVRDQSAFNLGGADAVAGNIEHVIDATGDPVITIFVATTAITREVVAIIGREIGLDETIMIFEDRPHLAGPAIGQDEIAGRCAFENIAIGIDQSGLDTKEGPRCGAGFEGSRPRQGRDQNAAGFGLPPGIDNRAALFADHIVIPQPGFRINRLTNRAQNADRFATGLFDRAVAFAHQGAQRRRRSIENIDVVLVAHFPTARGIGIGRHALKHHRGRAIGERSIENIGVTGDPADICGAPVDVTIMIIEHILMGH